MPSNEQRIDPKVEQEAIAAGGAALRRLYELVKDLPRVPHEHFTRYEVVVENGEVRLVQNADDIEFQKMWRDVMGR